MPLTLLITMLVCFAFSISIAVAIGGSAVLGIAIFDSNQLILVPKEMWPARCFPSRRCGGEPGLHPRGADRASWALQ